MKYFIAFILMLFYLNIFSQEGKVIYLEFSDKKTNIYSKKEVYIDSVLFEKLKYAFKLKNGNILFQTNVRNNSDFSLPASEVKTKDIKSIRWLKKNTKNGNI